MGVKEGVKGQRNNTLTQYYIMLTRIIIGILLVATGVLKLGDIWNIWNAEWLWQQPWTEYIAPVALVYLGGNAIIKGLSHDRDRWLQRPVPQGEDGKRAHMTVRYGGDEYIYHGETFRGARIDTHCGGVRLDLRDAIIAEDEEIDIHNSFGGVEIIIPRCVNVVVKSRSFIGGVSNDTNYNSDPTAKTIHIVASNNIGGVSIKN